MKDFRMQISISAVIRTECLKKIYRLNRTAHCSEYHLPFISVFHTYVTRDFDERLLLK
jgi:hypothetical protein